MKRKETKIKMNSMKKIKNFCINVGDFLMRKSDKNTARPTDEIPDDDLDLETRLTLTPHRKKSYRYGVSSSTKENIGQSHDKLHQTNQTIKSGLRPRNLQCTDIKKDSKLRSKTYANIDDRDQLAGPAMTHKYPLSMIPKQIQRGSDSKQSPNYSVNQGARPRRLLRQQLHIQKEANSSNPSYKFERFNYPKVGNPFFLSYAPTINVKRIKQQGTTQAAQVIDLDTDESDDLPEVIETTPPTTRKPTQLREYVEIDSDSPIFNKPKKSKKCKKIVFTEELTDSDDPIYEPPKPLKMNREILNFSFKCPDTKGEKKEFDQIHDSSKWIRTKKNDSKESTFSKIFCNENNNNSILPVIEINDKEKISVIKIREEIKFSSSNFDINSYLKRSNKPYHSFMDKNRVCQYNRTCLKFLQNYFNKIRSDAITNTYRDSNYNMSLAANKLRRTQSNMEYNNVRTFKQVHPENLEQYQEMEFIRNMVKFNELNEEPEAKKNHFITLFS